MDINNYQLTTMATAVYPECGTKSQRAVEYCIVGMAGEAGEALEFVKKLMRGDYNCPHDTDGDGNCHLHQPACPPAHHHPEFVASLKKEMGDTIWYWCRALEELGTDAEEILLTNLEKLQDRQRRGVLHGSGNSR